MLFNELIRANDDLKNKVLENTAISELSNQALAKYKTAAASDAGAADKAGEFKRGNKRFSGIVKATKKQFANDQKSKKPNDQGVAEDVEQQYLWHGSRQKIPMLNPRQSVDTGGAAGSNQNAIYATSDPKVAIAVGGLTTSDSDTAMFPNDPQIVLFSGKIRKGENVYLHKLPFHGPDGKPQFVQGAHDREFYSIPGVKGIKPVEIKAVPVDKYLNLIRQATPADLELRKKNTKDGVAEGLDEAVGGNYLYHATSASGLKGMLSSGGIRSAAGPQAATSAQTKLPTVSVTRDWGYASGANAQTQMASIGRDAILVLDRNAIESNFKTLGTSQSTHIKGLSLNPYLRKDGEARSQNTDPMARANAKGKSKYAEPTAKAGGEFEEAVVVPKGALPLKGTMVGFWVNPKSELINDPAIMNDSRRLDMVRPNQFVKATHQQGVAEAKGPCWKGYKQVGMKKKSGKKVPNCVPVSEDCEQIMSAIINQILINEAVQNNRR